MFRYSFFRAIPVRLLNDFLVEFPLSNQLEIFITHLLGLDGNLLLLLFCKNRYYHDNGKQQILK